MWYRTTHGISPGTVPKGLNILDHIEIGMADFFKTDRKFTNEELNCYDIRKATPEELSAIGVLIDMK